jgi:hypothetical protein
LNVIKKGGTSADSGQLRGRGKKSSPPPFPKTAEPQGTLIARRPREFKRGNVAKAENYAAAWRKINSAIKEGYFIEAVAIQESIVRDRLFRHLRVHHALPLRNRRNHDHTLHELIDKASATLTTSDGASLLSSLQDWRTERNNVVHALLRSDPEIPQQDATEFFARAKAAAVSGVSLARQVSNWCRRETTRLQRYRATSPI